MHSQHPPAVAHLPWAALKEDAQNWGTELGDGLPQDGLPLPVLTCHAPPNPCRNFVSSTTQCTRVARRALCVAVGRACQALVATVEEPTQCCCRLEGRNTTLMGKVINMRLRKTCPPSFDDTTGQGEGRGRKGGRGIGEGRGGEPILSSEGTATLPSFHEATPNFEDLEALDNITSEGKNASAESVGGIPEEHVKDTSILEDTIAAIVFLFVGAVLVLIKSRLFRFTKKKKVQQEDKDVESEETLVDETII